MDQLNDIIRFLLARAEITGNERFWILLAAAGLPALLLLASSRISGVFAALSILAAGGLLWAGVSPSTVAIILLGAAASLAAIDILRVRWRLARLEKALRMQIEAVRQLEVAHERHQSFMARQTLAIPPLAAEGTLAPAQAGSRTRADDAPRYAIPGANGMKLQRTEQ